MKFEQALAFLKDGRKIRRPHWGCCWHIELQDSIYGGKNIVHVSTAGDASSRFIWSASSRDMLVEDWEVVE